MNILRKIKNEPEKEIAKLRAENDDLEKKRKHLKCQTEKLEKELTEMLFLILDNEFCGIPFEAIEKLREMPASKEMTAKIVYMLNHAYDEDASFSADAPLWYAIVAEAHLHEDLIDPIINLFTTTGDDWDFLNEQGEYLLGKLTQKYPDMVMEKVIRAIDRMISEQSKFPYLFLFDAFYFANVEKYKDWFLKTLKNPNLYWLDPYIMHMGDLQIKEAVPVIKELLNSKNIDIFTERELKGAIEQIERGTNEYSESSMPYCESRGEWKEHYKACENRFTKSEEDDDYEDYEPEKSQKIGRNDPCPCGSGLKYKKCCGK